MNGPNYIYVDDWEDHYRFEEVKDSGFAPPIGSLDPAVMLDLKPVCIQSLYEIIWLIRRVYLKYLFTIWGRGMKMGVHHLLKTCHPCDDLSYFKYSDTVAYLEDNGSLRLDFTVEENFGHSCGRIWGRVPK